MTKRRSILNYLSVFCVSATLLFNSSGEALAKGQAVPDDFDTFLVFMATGTIPFQPHPDSNITGCGVSLFCDGDFFHQVIMGRDLSEIDAEASKAKAYFLSRFGIDVDALVSDGRLTFASFFLDPRGEYRAYSASGEKIPSEGWVVRDGGFVVTVLDPSGIELGGDFTGLGFPAIQQGGLLVFGNYNILKTNKSGRDTGEIIFSYRSDMPMIANAWGELVVNCQISVNAFEGGVHGGKAQGMGLVTLTPTFDGLTLSWRNVLTIGGL